MLQTQLLDIPLQGGLAEMVDKRLVPLGAWLTLKNCRRHKLQGLFKRFGTTVVPRTTSTGGALTGCIALGALDNTLLLIDDTTFWTHSDNTNTWVNRTSTLDTSGIAFNIRPWPATFEQHTAYATSNRIVTMSQCRTSDGLIHYAYEVVISGAADNAIYDMVIDEASQTIVCGPRLADSQGYAPRVMNCNGTVVVVYSNGTATPATIKARSKSSSTAAYGSATNLTVDQYTGQAKSVWDAQPFGGASNNFVLSYEASTLNGLHTKIFSNTFVLQASATWTNVASDYRAVACAPVASEGIWVGVSRNVGNIVKIQGTRLSDTTAIEQFAPVFVIDGTAYGLAATSSGVGEPVRLTIGRVDSTHAFYAGSTGEAFSTLVAFYRNVMDNGGSIGTPQAHGGYHVVSRPFIASDGRQYMFISDLTYLDSTPTALLRSLYLLDTEAAPGENGSGRIVGKAAVRFIDASVNNFFMSRVVTDVIVNVNDVRFPCASTRQLGVTQYPIEQVTASFKNPARHKVQQYAASAFISPGQLFDRNRATEIGFHRIPSVPILTDTGAGVLSAGRYAYCVVMRYISSTGEIVRSCPSATQTITLAVNHQTSVQVQLGTLTDRQPRDVIAGFAQPEAVIAELYRTAVNSSTLYLVAEQLTSSGNTAFGGIVFNDNVADSAILLKPILYTNSSLPNLPVPNLQSLCVWKNRLCGISPDNHTIWISSEYIPGFQSTFHDSYNTYLTQDTLSAIGVVDDKLIAFSPTNVYFVEGTPADALGNGNSLIPVPISADFGCTDARSVIAHDNGLMFKSRRSFGIVGRNLNVTEIGQPVQDKVLAYPVVKCAVDLDFDQEVRFSMAATESASTGIVLTYNSSSKEWYWHEYYDSIGNVTGANFVAGTQINGIYYACPSNGAVIKEDRTLYSDAGVFVSSDYESPWIDLGNIAQFQRCKRLFTQFERITPVDVEFSFFIDGSDTAVQTVTYAYPQIEASLSLPIIDLLTQVADQKSNMVRIRVRDLTPTGGVVGTGQGMKLYGLSIQLGLKKGIGTVATS